MIAAEIDGRLIDPGVAAVGDNREGIARFSLGIPHDAAGANHCGHGGIDDDVGRNVEAGDAFVRVDHGEVGTGGVGGGDIGFDHFAFVVRKIGELSDQVA